ncbi:MAG: C40 family peptidase [Muribaculaceae bacterium]|nr:C40 family peptidase [Muribaculaceae bacterium]
MLFTGGIVARVRVLVVRILLPLLVAGAVASCHKGSTVKSHRDYHRDSSRSGRVDGQGESTSEAWSTLTIPLSRDDNAALYDELRSWLGTPYQYAKANKGRGTDCSGMVVMVYHNVFGKDLERNSARIYEKNCTPIKRESLRESDLVFFHGKQGGSITHVGIYLKEGYFVHTSSSRGVMVSNLADRYWNGHYECAGRVN